ncbi:transglutaminase-like domain-containing protein [Spirosoma luteum]|uniref:transglutaminase-like domain-containing protein n=1 Tax=Spirosoma luteum TaxID=431553 RepID=UPI000698B002|nr:transglutaminase-like domain-containing protein [Spirosoma luteum]
MRKIKEYKAKSQLAWRLVGLAVLIGSLGATAERPRTLPRERAVTFTYQTVMRDIPVGAKRVSLWLPVPHDSPFQRITDLTIDCSYPYQIDSAQYGNRMLHLSLLNPQTDSVAVAMRFTARRLEHIQERLNAPSSSVLPHRQELTRWLQPDQLVPIDGQIRQWAEKVVNQAGAKTDLAKARAIYNHVIATVKYDKTGTGWGRGDIYYACDARRGNCTDFHAVFIGYCRAVGIPARFAIGFSLPTDRPAGQISGYHCWAEFWANGIGWVPVDASEAARNPARRQYFFGAHDENRIEFSVGRDLTLYPGQTNPLNYFIYPYAEVDNEPITTLANHVEYRNVPGALESKK